MSNRRQLSTDTKMANRLRSKGHPFNKDIIYSPEGQWKYPGQITRIPGGAITMRGVPYPVLGVDDQGNQQMMYPEQDYQFPGSYVTEYPMVQKGGAKRPLFKSNKGAYADSVLTANKDKEWVNRILTKNSMSISDPTDPNRTSTHLMSDNDQGYVFPSVVNLNGQLVYLPSIGINPEDYARETNTGIQLPKKEGTWFARNGYKTGKIGQEYFPNFKNGGDFIDMELDDDEIAEYKRRGYKVEFQDGEEYFDAELSPMTLWKKKVNGWPPDDPPKKTILGINIDKYGYLLPPTEIIAAKDKTTDYVLNELGKYSTISKQEPFRKWRIAGSPKITLDNQTIPYKYIDERGSEKVYRRPMYFNNENRISLSDTNDIKGYDNFKGVYAELPHSFQFTKSPHIKNRANDDYERQRREGQSYDNFQYSIPGTIEHDAHTYLQPLFEKIPSKDIEKYLDIYNKAYSNYEKRFNKGGEYFDAELSPEEIEYYKSLGYQIEDLE
jgi:hypothetical protein